MGKHRGVTASFEQKNIQDQPWPQGSENSRSLWRAPQARHTQEKTCEKVRLQSSLLMRSRLADLADHCRSTFHFLTPLKLGQGLKEVLPTFVDEYLHFVQLRRWCSCKHFPSGRGAEYAR